MPSRGFTRWQYKGSWLSRVKQSGCMFSKFELNIPSGEKKGALG